MTSSPQSSVGMVGVGNMGGRMTRRMTAAGYDVRAVDADPARIPASGAQPAASLAELAAASGDATFRSVHEDLGNVRRAAAYRERGGVRRERYSMHD